MQPMDFDANCQRCPRLANFLNRVKDVHSDYFCRPVPPFGVPDPKLLIVGLAPGMHGANRTGRPFTGDHAGILLYQTLHKFGFATAPQSVSREDGLELIDCRITNAVKCLPPDNKPETAEVATCNRFLAAELSSLAKNTAVLALGNVAHGAVLRALKLKSKEYPFVHAARYPLATGLVLHDSYHCSRYNTNTRRLTQSMFEAVFQRIKEDSSCLM